MKRRWIRAGMASLVATALCLGAPAARAGPEPMSAEARGRAERAFVLGRLEDVTSLLGASNALVDREAVEVLNRFWRPTGTKTGMFREVDDGSVSWRRLRWLSAWPESDVEEYPLPREGEVEPYPALTALVLDRRRRESQGVRGLPGESPLAKLSDEAVQAFLPFAVRAFAGPPATSAPGAPTDPDAELAARLSTAGRRNALVAAAAGLFFLLAALGLTWRVGRSRFGRSSPEIDGGTTAPRG